MSRTPEAESFFHAVYAAIQEVPPGRVTSYGHIAKLIGTRTSPASPISPVPPIPTFTALKYPH
jgi:methylated-DNA-protein-cysteine methyltransferase related protein